MPYHYALSLGSLLRAFPGNIAQGMIWGIMALGLYISYRLLDFADLTVDGSLSTGAAVTVMLMLNGCPAIVAVLIAFIAGCVAGLITGVLHTVLKIAPILSGILTQIALYSINLHILGNKANQAISVTDYDLLLSLRNTTKSIIVALVFIVIIIALLYEFFGTEIGAAIRATGNNAQMAKAQGIDISLMKVIGLALSNGIVALSGGLLAQYQGFADVSLGRGAIVIGLAAIIIGSVLFEGPSHKDRNFAVVLSSAVVGGIIYYISIGIVLWLKLPTNDMKLFTAILVAVFLSVSNLSFNKKGDKANAVDK
ncbi:MAG: ABC transporter permease [Erysipelotrichaceae bacterium]|nr:ABC transporter permease [Erysipelotrichaceae bacterium]